jgi:hypothetical protein
MGPRLQLHHSSILKNLFFHYLLQSKSHIEMVAASQRTQEVRQIAKLNGKNWSSRRYGVNLLLEKNRLNRVVSKQELIPPKVRIFLNKLISMQSC